MVDACLGYLLGMDRPHYKMYSNPRLLFKKYGNISKKKKEIVNTVWIFKCLFKVKLVPDKPNTSKE